MRASEYLYRPLTTDGSGSWANANIIGNYGSGELFYDGPEAGEQWEISTLRIYVRDADTTNLISYSGAGTLADDVFSVVVAAGTGGTAGTVLRDVVPSASSGVKFFFNLIQAGMRIETNEAGTSDVLVLRKDFPEPIVLDGDANERFEAVIGVEDFSALNEHYVIIEGSQTV